MQYVSSRFFNFVHYRSLSCRCTTFTAYISLIKSRSVYLSPCICIYSRHGLSYCMCDIFVQVKQVLNSFRNFENAAVKIVDRTHAPRDYQEKFMPRELTLWPLLRHPNLIQFLECFEENNRVYMVRIFSS